MNVGVRKMNVHATVTRRLVCKIMADLSVIVDDALPPLHTRLHVEVGGASEHPDIRVYCAESTQRQREQSMRGRIPVPVQADAATGSRR